MSTLEQIISTASAFDAETAFNTAFGLQQQGQLESAAALYQAILRVQPQHFNATHMLAILAMQNPAYGPAAVLFERAIELRPQRADVHNNFGNALRGLQQPLAALDSYEQALRIEPGYVVALYNCCTLLLELERLPEALLRCEQVLVLQPDHAEAHHQRGDLMLGLQRWPEALASYEQALRFKPDYVEAHNNRGAVLFMLERLPEALASYEQALQVQPDYVKAHNNRGRILVQLGRRAEALACYEQALRINPDYADAYNNYGSVLQELNLPEAAISSFEQAQRLDPEHAEAHLNAALCRLRIGDFKRGWQQYEWRFKIKSNLARQRVLPQTLWLGQEDLHGKTILLHGEQGFGDMIQFCRYAAQVARLGATVLLEVHGSLMPVVQGIAGVTRLVRRGARLPDCDYHCPLMSLPLVFQTDLASIHPAPYLFSEAQKNAQWGVKLGPKQHTRVGLVWNGSSVHQNDAARSFPFEMLAPILRLPAEFYCLQTELRPADRAALEQITLPLLGDALYDFSDTAALISLMDLVITVDTSVAHLAGAMGKPVWILLPFVADWRWLQERTDSPWYGSARLFRQPALGDWGSVLEQVAIELKQWQSAPPRLISVTSAPALFLSQSEADPFNQGFALHQAGDLEGAAVLYQAVLQAQPSHFNALQLLAVIAISRHEFIDAIRLLDQAISIEPLQAHAHHHRGIALNNLLRLDEALASYATALQLQPDYVDARINDSLCRLLSGDFARGWPQYEWRWQQASVRADVQRFSAAPWLGQENLAGKTILLHCEQGLGDTFQFCRYARQVALLGATVILEVQATLKSVLRHVEGVAMIVAVGEARPDIDYHCPLMSLPLAFQTDLTSISELPYIDSDAQRSAAWQAKLQPGNKKRVGLVWSGFARHSNDARRSIPLEQLAILLNEDADYYCLQKELHPADRVRLAQMTSIHFFGDEINDFSDTAALVALMDLVITVDTSVAHLAGAMGKPVWILLSFKPDWRWLLEREDSPWYGSARLFRQSSEKDWSSVLSRVAEALRPALSALTAQTQQHKLETAFALHQQGQLDQAAVLYEEIVQLQAGHFDALQLLAAIATERHDYAAAVRLFAQVIQIDASHADVHHNLGNALRGLQQWPLALDSYERALQLRPDFVEALNCRGNVLLDMKRGSQALASYEQALQLQPGYALLHNNRGLALATLKRWPEAMRSYEQALLLKPDYASAHCNLGLAWFEQRQLRSALHCYAQALQYEPEHAEARFNDGVCGLLMGDFLKGWQQYEWRWNTPALRGAARVLRQALWLGQESLRGQTILLHSEQGLGDTIQFSRYVRQVAALGARVILEVPPELKTLLFGIAGAALVVGKGEVLPEFDYHCPLMSLPLAFQTDLASISGLPYLHSAAQKTLSWQAQLPHRQQPNVGLVWSGNPEHCNDGERSIPLPAWDAVLQVPAHFYCLQPTLRQPDLDHLAHRKITCFGAALQDFSDTAALIAALDLVITVDTGVAHLAGAMGKPVWILLPFNPDWRWLLERSDSPWYGSARLFRQPARGDWGSVLAQVASELAAL